jgi:hypothetical protein
VNHRSIALCCYKKRHPVEQRNLHFDPEEFSTKDCLLRRPSSHPRCCMIARCVTGAAMIAPDVMTEDVVMESPGMPPNETARLLLGRGISAALGNAGAILDINISNFATFISHYFSQNGIDEKVNACRFPAKAGGGLRRAPFT